MRLPPALSLAVVALVAALALVAAPAARAQPAGVLQIDDEPARFLERLEALGALTGDLTGRAALGAQPLSAAEAGRMLDTLAADSAALARLSPRDRLRLAELRGEAPAPGAAWVASRLGPAYRDGRHAVAAEGDGWRVVAEPLANLSLGRAVVREGGETTSETVYQNTRGARVAGRLGRVFFESRLEETQRRVALPAFAQATAPRQGFVKFTGDEAYDYFRATGVVGVETRFVEARFGRDRNRWGFGSGSLALSNVAPVYDQLQLRTAFWRVHYTSLFARFQVPRRPGSPDALLPSKYGALHRLAVALPGRVDVELFEQVVFADDTLSGRRQGFELAYLNPIIFYRAVESDIGSGDNALLGAGVGWTAAPGVRLYAQGLLDELSVRRFTSDWWANKWGYVVGAHVSDPGWGAARLRHLDVEVAYARQRPFLYSHRSEASSYTHYGDALGHPAGPNSSDLSVRARYAPLRRLTLALDAAHTVRGRNPDSLNVGADPRRSYDTRDLALDLATPTFIGVRQRVWQVEGRISWEALPSLFLEATLQAEAVRDAERGTRGFAAPSLAVRWGLPFESFRY